jgi:hypothetical protein
MKVFLETSIHIQRLLHTDERKAEIREKLAGNYILTSTYVYMEFRRGFATLATFTAASDFKIMY